jgi:heterodisulfide reductase subunit A-like polyferredoxin
LQFPNPKGSIFWPHKTTIINSADKSPQSNKKANKPNHPTSVLVHILYLLQQKRAPTYPMVEEEEIVIVGGGIAGLATALALSRVGMSARVLERYPELRATGAALTLFPNAWFALRALGVDRKLTSVYNTVKK